MTIARRLRGIRASIPFGYILARTDPGEGDVQPVKASDLITKGILGSAAASATGDFDAAGAAAAALVTAEAYTDAAVAGLGDGDVVGPASATDGDIAQYDGTTGKLIKDGGLSSASFDAAGAAAAAQAASLPLHGTADDALKWHTARALSFTGDATGSGSVDGSAAVATALTLATSGVTAATYGDATHVPQIAFDAKGRATSASNVAITQPAGANPTAQVGPSAINGSATTFMRSDGAPKLADTAVTPASYGDSTHYTTFTVDQQGRLTAAASVAANAGTVTSVAATVPTHMAVGGSPITSSGTLAFTWDGIWNFGNGSASAPSVLFDTNSGLWYDATNTAIGLSIAGVQVGQWLNTASGPLLTLGNIFPTAAGPNLTAIGFAYVLSGGGPAQFTVYGEGTVAPIISRFTNDTLAPTFAIDKSRGLIASPLPVVLGDTLGNLNFRGQNTSGTIAKTVAGRLRFTVTETGTVSSTAMGVQGQLQCNPIGSATPVTVFTFDNENGLQYLSNVFLDQNRIFRPRSYTVGGLPTVTATGLIQGSDEGGAAKRLYSDGVNWRRDLDLAVASATKDYTHVTGRLSARPTPSKLVLIQNSYQKLSDAGLLSKLLGLWVHALDTSTDGLLDWIGTNNLSIIGSPTFTAGQGFTGDGSSGLLNTGLTVAGFGAALNNFAIGTYVRTAGAGKAVIGINGTGSTRSVYLQSNTSGALTVRVQDGTDDSWTPAAYTGMHTLTRGNSSNYQQSVNDGAQHTIARTSTTGGQVLCFLGTNDSTGAEYSAAQLSVSFVATTLSAADITNLFAIIDYLLVGLGAISDSVARLPPAANFQNSSIYVSDLGGGAGSIRSNGTNWLRENADGYETLGDADKTLTTLTNGRNQNLTATLTAARTITLSGTDAKGTTCGKGSWFLIRNSGLGAFTLTIKDGPSGSTLATFPSLTAKWAKTTFDGTNWQLMADGSV